MSKVGEACNNCNKRHAGCHDTCVTYFAKQMVEEMRRNQIQKASLPDRQQKSFFVTNIRNQRRQRNAV